MLKILIAEDDRELRQLFSHVLNRHGYTVTGVSNGQEALDAMDKDFFDMILPGTIKFFADYYIIGDSYRIDGYRQLMAYSLKTDTMRCLVKSYDPQLPIVDIRCDLHARFVWDGKYISFDTVHDHKRQIALLSADALDF